MKIYRLSASEKTVTFFSGKPVGIVVGEYDIANAKKTLSKGVDRMFVFDSLADNEVADFQRQDVDADGNFGMKSLSCVCRTVKPRRS